MQSLLLKAGLLPAPASTVEPWCTKLHCQKDTLNHVTITGYCHSFTLGTQNSDSVSCKSCVRKGPCDQMRTGLAKRAISLVSFSWRPFVCEHALGFFKVAEKGAHSCSFCQEHLTTQALLFGAGICRLLSPGSRDVFTEHTEMRRHMVLLPFCVPLEARHLFYLVLPSQHPFEADSISIFTMHWRKLRPREFPSLPATLRF